MIKTTEGNSAFSQKINKPVAKFSDSGAIKGRCITNTIGGLLLLKTTLPNGCEWSSGCGPANKKLVHNPTMTRNQAKFSGAYLDQQYELSVDHYVSPSPSFCPFSSRQNYTDLIFPVLPRLHALHEIVVLLSIRSLPD